MPLTCKDVGEQCDRQDDKGHGDISHSKVSQEVVGDIPHLGGAIDNSHDQPIIDDSEQENQRVRHR